LDCGLAPSMSSLPTVPESNADLAKLREHLAWTRESYNESLKELQDFRAMSCADRLELEHLRRLFKQQEEEKELSEETSSLLWQDQLQSLAREKADCEMRLIQNSNQVRELKYLMKQLQGENKSLQQQVANLQDGSSSNEGSGVALESGETVQELQEQVNKWEALYFESAEVGSNTIQKLEEQLAQLQIENERLAEENNAMLLAKSSKKTKPTEDSVARLTDQLDQVQKENERLAAENKSLLEARNPTGAVSDEHDAEILSGQLVKAKQSKKDVDEIAWLDRMDELEQKLLEKDEQIALLQRQLRWEKKRPRENQYENQCQQKQPLDGEVLSSVFGLERNTRNAVLDMLCCGRMDFVS